MRKSHHAEPATAEQSETSEHSATETANSDKTFCGEFAYTDEQWAEIVRSLRHLQCDEASLKALRQTLERLSGIVSTDSKSAKARDDCEKKAARHDWTRISQMAVRLMELIIARAKIEEPGYEPSIGSYSRELDALFDIYESALERIAPVKRGKAGGFAGLTDKQLYLFLGLKEWTKLGGALKVSRHPKTRGRWQGTSHQLYSQ